MPTDFTAELIRTVAAAGGEPLVSTYQQPVLRALYCGATRKSQMQTISPHQSRERMEIRPGAISEFADPITITER